MQKLKTAERRKELSIVKPENPFSSIQAKDIFEHLSKLSLLLLVEIKKKLK